MTAPLVGREGKGRIRSIPSVHAPQARRRYTVSLPPDTPSALLDELGAVVELGHLPVVFIEAESRSEARQIVAERLEQETTG